MCQCITTPAKQSTGKAPHQCLLGKHNRQAWTQRNLDANRQEGMIRADIIPALSWDWPIIPGKIMQGRPGGGGSFRNGLLHSRPLPRRRMNQRPQASPTLLHCPDSSQHHNPTDYLTDRRRWVNQPQVPLLKQSSPQPALHLSADSLSDRTLPESMLPQGVSSSFAVPCIAPV
jgi:hypothetical protein